MAGAVPLRMLADRSGLTGYLSAALARVDFFPIHDRGRVLVDVATSISCGARDIVDMEALRAQQQLFGPVASDTTAGWALGEVGAAGRARIAAARSAARGSKRCAPRSIANAPNRSSSPSSTTGAMSCSC
jgi:hypothetical protein